MLTLPANTPPKCWSYLPTHLIVDDHFNTTTTTLLLHYSCVSATQCHVYISVVQSIHIHALVVRHVSCMSHDITCRDIKRIWKNLPNNSISTYLTNQRPTTKILSNGITVFQNAGNSYRIFGPIREKFKSFWYPYICAKLCIVHTLIQIRLEWQFLCNGP